MTTTTRHPAELATGTERLTLAKAINLGLRAALATDPVVRPASRPASALEPDALEADADAGDAEGDDGAE